MLGRSEVALHDAGREVGADILGSSHIDWSPIIFDWDELGQ